MRTPWKLYSDSHRSMKIGVFHIHFPVRNPNRLNSSMANDVKYCGAAQAKGKVTRILRVYTGRKFVQVYYSYVKNIFFLLTLFRKLYLNVSVLTFLVLFCKCSLSDVG